MGYHALRLFIYDTIEQLAVWLNPASHKQQLGVDYWRVTTSTICSLSKVDNINKYSINSLLMLHKKILLIYTIF